MGCTHLCDKKSQKAEDLKNNIDNTKEDILLPNITESDNSNPVLVNENNKKDDVVIINIDDPNNLNMVLNSGIVSGNLRDYLYLIGKHFSNMEEFLNLFTAIFQLTWKLPTTFYTLSYEEVKKIIEDIKSNVNPPIFSEKLYSFIINSKNKIIECNNSQNIYKSIYELFLDNTEFQKEIIISALKSIIGDPNFNITCALIKLFQDIGFCIRILFYKIKSLVLKDIYCYEYKFDIRILFFLNLIENLCYEKEYPADLLKFATEASRIKDTIILGDKQFRNNIKALNLPCERINDLDDNMLDLFFYKPFKINKKYNVVKYFVICEKKDFDDKYLEQLTNLSSKYGFAYLFLVYIKNEQLIDIRDDLKIKNSLIYFCDNNELVEIYKDNNERLRPRLRDFLPENINPIKIELNQIHEEMFYGILQELKSTSEEGWDLFGAKKDGYNFNYAAISGCFQNFISHILCSFINAYKDHNSLEIFFKYYSNYFFLTLQPEFVMNLTAFEKCFFMHTL